MDSQMVCEHPYFQQMQQVLMLTQQMMQFAQEDQWDQLAEVDAERQQLLVNMAPLPSKEADATQCAELVAMLLQMNEQLVELGKCKLNEYSDQHKNISQGRKAVAAYGG